MSDEQIGQMAQVFTPSTAASLAERIVAEAIKHLGEHETRGNGLANDGPPVEFACKRWISASRYEYLLREGKLEWCGGWVCSVLDEAGSKAVHKIASLSCTSLWVNAAKLAVPGEVATVGMVGTEATVHGAAREPQPGDLLLTDSDLNGKPGHVVIIERIEGTTIHTIGGNSGPHSDAVARVRYDAASPKLFGFIRVLV